MTAGPSFWARMAPLLLALLAILASLTPLAGRVGGFVGPNLLLAVFFLWAARREEALWPGVVFIAVLLYEMLRAGPIGAESLAMMAVIEASRAHPEVRRFRPFWVEWLRLGVAAVAVEAIVWGLLTATLAQAPGWIVSAERILATILVYPLVAAIGARVFGVTGRQDQDGDAFA